MSPWRPGTRPWFGTKRPLPENTTDRGTAPQGGIVASASDLARYLMMMMNGRDDVLSAEGKALMMRPDGDTSPFYGFGWFVDPGNGSVWHSGTSPGFESLATMLPSRKRGVVVLVNGGSGLGFGETAQLRNGIAATALGLDYAGEGSRWPQKALFVTLVLLPVAFLLSMVWAWRHRAQIRAKSGPFGLFSWWFPLLTTLAAAWVTLSLVPRPDRRTPRHDPSVRTRHGAGDDRDRRDRGPVGRVPTRGRLHRSIRPTLNRQMYRRLAHRGPDPCRRPETRPGTPARPRTVLLRRPRDVEVADVPEVVVHGREVRHVRHDRAAPAVRRMHARTPGSSRSPDSTHPPRGTSPPAATPRPAGSPAPSDRRRHRAFSAASIGHGRAPRSQSSTAARRGCRRWSQPTVVESNVVRTVARRRAWSS